MQGTLVAVQRQRGWSELRAQIEEEEEDSLHQGQEAAKDMMTGSAGSTETVSETRHAHPDLHRQVRRVHAGLRQSGVRRG